MDEIGFKRISFSISGFDIQSKTIFPTPNYWRSVFAYD